MRRPLLLALLPIGLSLLACVSGEMPSKEDLADIAEACEGEDLSSLSSQNDISDECREAINGLLPDKQTSFEDRVVVLDRDEVDGDPLLIVQGVEGARDPITLEEWQGGSWEVVLEDGSRQQLPPEQVQVKPIEEVEDAFSIAFVTDYSASMRDEDLEQISTFYLDLIAALPPVYEAEHVAFSETLTLVTDWSSDPGTLEAALAPQESIEREGTALYDGMGEGVDGLSLREGRVRIAVVATDGQENSSITWTRRAIVDRVEEEELIVVMVGSLFSDLEEMRVLAGDRGVFFYAAAYSELRAEVGAWIESLSDSVELRFIDLPAGASAVVFTGEGDSHEISL